MIWFIQVHQKSVADPLEISAVGLLSSNGQTKLFDKFHPKQLETCPKINLSKGIFTVGPRVQMSRGQEFGGRSSYRHTNCDLWLVEVGGFALFIA